VPELAHDRCEREEERPKAEDREYVRGKHDERIKGYGENCRDGIHGKEQVGGFERDEHNEQRRREYPAVHPYEETALLVRFGYGQDAPHQPEDRVLLRVHFVIRSKRHSHRGDHQERAENVDDPVQPVDQFDPGKDERQPHDKGAQDSPEQHLVLIDRGDSEIREQEKEDEQVIYAERFFDEVSGQKFERRLPAPPVMDKRAKAEGKRDPNRGP